MLGPTPKERHQMETVDGSVMGRYFNKWTTTSPHHPLTIPISLSTRPFIARIKPPFTISTGAENGFQSSQRPSINISTE
ncbi:hypothetical protein J6590_019459 [Homalodisca vitripennis]|nr:hypothetical protein J6590_019459 [Homalodisca vitripennis]